MESRLFWTMNARLLPLPVLLISLLGLASLFASDSPTGVKQKPIPRDSRPAAAFQVFRTPTETLPPAEQRRIYEGRASYKAQKVLSAQLAATRHGRLWMFHTAHFICISHTRGMACARGGRAMQEGVNLGVFDPPDERHGDMHNFLVQGIAPDDVSQVQVLIDNSRSLTVDVKKGVFSVAADKPIHIKRLLRD